MLSDQIKQLQRNINQQLDNSALSKNMRQAENYKNMPKSTAIMQTSSHGVGDRLSLQNKKKSHNQPNYMHLNHKEHNPTQLSGKERSHTEKGNVRNIEKYHVKTIEKGNLKKSRQQNKIEQREFLITQNKALKEQTLSMVEQLEQLLAISKPGKKYGINLTSGNQSEAIRLKKAELYSQQIKIVSLETKIASQQRQLEYVYDDKEVISKEAEVKSLEKELEELQLEKKTLTGILKNQHKDIDSNLISPEFQYKLAKTREQLEHIKEQCKMLQSRSQENERLLRKKHEQAVNRQEKVKRLEKIVRQSQDSIRKGDSQKVVTVQMIAEVERQIETLEDEHTSSEKSWADKISGLDAELQLRKLELERNQIILRDKDREVRLNDLRIKELKKLAATTLPTRKASVSGDQGQSSRTGRQRNILQMDNRERIYESAEEDPALSRRAGPQCVDLPSI